MVGFAAPRDDPMARYKTIDAQGAQAAEEARRHWWYCFAAGNAMLECNQHWLGHESDMCNGR
eukprot:15441952-Alexandrium_andersonii.AAC.1